MSAPWQQDFDIYERDADGMRVLILVDLAARPLEDHPVRLEVTVALQRPREDGLRDSSELEAFAAFEDGLVEAVKARLDAIFLGRFTCGGHVTFFFQLPGEQEAAAGVLGDLLPDLDPYQLDWEVELDPDWQAWTEALDPDPYELQVILNRRLVRIFEERGDDLTAEREVDHHAFFTSEADARACAAALALAGFRVDEPTRGAPDDEDEDEDAAQQAPDEQDDEEPEWMVEFHRVDKLSDGRPDEFVADALEVVLEHAGVYGGWGAPHVR